MQIERWRSGDSVPNLLHCPHRVNVGCRFVRIKMFMQRGTTAMACTRNGIGWKLKLMLAAAPVHSFRILSYCWSKCNGTRFRRQTWDEITNFMNKSNERGFRSIFAISKSFNRSIWCLRYIIVIWLTSLIPAKGRHCEVRIWNRIDFRKTSNPNTWRSMTLIISTIPIPSSAIRVHLVYCGLWNSFRCHLSQWTNKTIGTIHWKLCQIWTAEVEWCFDWNAGVLRYEKHFLNEKSIILVSPKHACDDLSSLHSLPPTGKWHWETSTDNKPQYRTSASNLNLNTATVIVTDAGYRTNHKPHTHSLMRPLTMMLVKFIRLR